MVGALIWFLVGAFFGPAVLGALKKGWARV
jgi:hypothetical protein